ncbi:MAG: PDZ domain-containing protein [Blastocatellia bacterium]|nr:PDZ domain-containing protein [Blastocatellia bacterium]
MLRDRKSLSPLCILVTLCLVLLAVDQARAQERTVFNNPAIDMNGYLRISAEAAKYREARRISEAEFIRMSSEPGTIILDARSRRLFQFLHIKGAINLSFPDIAVTSLEQTIPDKSTRILIYCNNNFLGAQVAFPTKIPTASLNLSTFIALYNYGYRNIYELGPLLDIKKARLEFESSDDSQLIELIKMDAPIQIEKGGGPYVGVYLGDVTEDRAKILQLPEVRGALVGKVDDGSPAARAGLLENDVIFGFNGKKVQNRAQFFLLLIDATPGSRVMLEIVRKGQLQLIPVELGYRRSTAFIEQRQQANQLSSSPANTIPDTARKEAPAEVRNDPLPVQAEQTNGLQQMASASRFYLGVNAAPLSKQLAKYFNVDHGGVLVTEITPGSLAERVGVKAGDCIIKINDDTVASLSDLNIRVEKLFRDQVANNLSLTIVREGKEQKIEIKSDSK